MIADIWPDRIDVPIETFLASSACQVLRRFGDRVDSRTLVVGLEFERQRYVLKHAADPEAVGWLSSALRFHTAVRHRTIPTVVHHIRTPGGLALIEQWAPGQVLADGYDEAVLPPEHPGSTYRRFLDLPAGQIAAALEQLIEAHVVVADAGFVAVDLYDGCVVYDFDEHRLSLIDLDNYCPGPYILETDRQLGSSTYMAPEEFTRGATIDERTTIFTLGRLAQVYLGCARKAPAAVADFRGSVIQFDVAAAASEPSPDDRIQTVAELHAAWSETL